MLSRIFAIMKRSFRLSRSNSFLIFVLIAPLLYALIFNLIFNYWKTKPLLAVYAPEDSGIVAALEENEAIQLKKMNSADEVLELVESRLVDVGVVIPEGFESDLREGRVDKLKVYINGGSLARDRAITLAALAQALRQVSPPDVQVNFQQVRLGKEQPLDLFELFFPLIVLIVIMVGAYMIPASFIVQEKERRTLSALLVTPVSIAEIFIAFGISGILISLFMAVVMLALTVGLTQQLLVIAAILLASIMSAELGLMMGIKARDMNTLIALMKSLNIFFIGPAILEMFPSVPDWVVKIFPTYYLFDPIVQITLHGKGFSDIAWEFGLLVVFILVLLVPLVMMARSAKFAAQ